MTEYSLEDYDTKTTSVSNFRRGSIAASLASSLGRESTFEGVALPGDPNIVILPRFEDLSRRTTKELKSPTSPIARPPFIKKENSDDVLPSRNSDLSTLRHFRDVVWKQLVPPEHGPDSSITLLDEAAAHFPPVCWFS